MLSILIGCDPEVFVKKDKSFLSAFGLIPGDKKNPFKVNRGAVQVDGMALEFNIDPAASEDEFCINVQDVFAQLKAMVPGYEVVVAPVANFEPQYMLQQPAAALELGCDPDYNAWTNGMVNPKPQGERPFRTASGHIHIGWTKDQNEQDGQHLDMCHTLVKQLDYYLGLPSIFYDGDLQRREMYGKAGCYRPKSYGVEYRTLSNMWLTNEALMRFVYRNTIKAVTDLQAGIDLAQMYGDVQDIINLSQKEKAQEIIDKCGLEVYNV